MTLNPILLRQIAFYSKIMLVSAAIGAVIALLRADSVSLLRNFLSGVSSGLVIGLGCSLTEVAVGTALHQRWSRRLPIVVFFALRALGFSLAILIGLVGPILIFTGTLFWEDPSFRGVFVISVLIAVAFSAGIEITRLLGTEATLSLLTGKYRRARLEDRIVLFADLIGSTALAERVGDLQFHAFLSDVAQDLARPVAFASGDVHRYVGDAVIVTWPSHRKGVADAVLECAAHMHAALAKAAPTYEAMYGCPAQLRIAVHCGPLAAGEVGDWKKEIALLGDTMNTAARIEGAARANNVRTVLSEDMARCLSPQAAGNLTRLPGYAANGKQEDLAIWGVT
ncbi:MAG: adenylate/guanylate cyclase domain-containing protein [Sulfitobacter sp.]